MDVYLKFRLDSVKRTPPIAPLSYALTLCYRNCRYLEHGSLTEPVMRILAKAIWVDEERRHIDDSARARVLAAFDAVWDADEGDDDDLPLCVAKLHQVVAAVVSEAGFRDEDFRDEDQDANEAFELDYWKDKTWRTN